LEPHGQVGKVIALPLQPFPALLWWRAAAESSARIDLQADFIKQSARNRIALANANGDQRFTLPVHRPSGVKCSQFGVALVEDGWPRRLLQTLRTCYGSAPYFEHYFDEIAALLEKPFTDLGAFNAASISWSADALGVKVPLPVSTENPASVFNLAARGHSFGGASWDEPPYVRVFSDRTDFVQGVSVLDALFHLGPETARHLKSSSLR
jgi:hypothetical protein